MNNAQAFAEKFAGAIKMRPEAFVVGGKETAVVTPDGQMALMSGSQLTDKEAIDLRAWIKKNFMEGTT